MAETKDKLVNLEVLKNKVYKPLTEDVESLSNKTATLESTVGESPASEETGETVLAMLKEHANKMGGVVDLIAELPTDDSGLSILSQLKDKTKLLKEIADNMED